MTKFLNNKTGLRTKAMMTNNTKPDFTKKVIKKTKKPVDPELGLGGGDYNLNDIKL